MQDIHNVCEILYESIFIINKVFSPNNPQLQFVWPQMKYSIPMLQIHSIEKCRVNARIHAYACTC